jgi:hypothetical protein
VCTTRFWNLKFNTCLLLYYCYYICYTDVEDLTHKTGNFKQFHIFVSMLESAITQVCQCIVSHSLKTIILGVIPDLTK